MYWTPAQMLAHMTVNGASLRTGDLFASGTVSGPEPDQRGWLLELSWGGAEPLALADGGTAASWRTATRSTITRHRARPGRRPDRLRRGQRPDHRLVPRLGRSVRESADPGVRRQGAARSSYRAYSDRAATPPAGGWAVEFRGEPRGTGRSGLSLADSWVWDFWFADDGERYHLFFLRASRALLDPDRRHRRASLGHAVSTDLRHWTLRADALVADDALSRAHRII